MKRELIVYLWHKIFGPFTDSCADDHALYFEAYVGGVTPRYFKLLPEEVSEAEYEAAWNRACGKRLLP